MLVPILLIIAEASVRQDIFAGDVTNRKTTSAACLSQRMAGNKITPHRCFNSLITLIVLPIYRIFHFNLQNMKSFLISALVFFTSFAPLTSACIYKRETGSATWSYTGETGPLLWHKLNSTNSACAQGKQQSPINVSSDVATSNATLEYPVMAKFNIENNGHTIEVTPKDNLTAELGGQEYKLLQFHFHTPSEHRLNLEHYPLEVHLVHQHVETGAIAVVGVFFDTAIISDPFLAGIVLDNVTEVTQPNDSPIELPIILSTIKALVEKSKLFTYAGSLTTPPCTEAVTWFVAEIPLTVSLTQYTSFKKIMKFNSRNTQNDLHAPPSANLITEACKA